MNPLARLPVGMRKELSALAPLWMAVALTVAAAAVLPDSRVAVVAFVAFIVGSAALGAQSIGHEYTYQTLGVLLAQPRDRRHLLLTKVGVLALMLLALSELAWFTLFRHGRVLRAVGWEEFPAPFLVSLTSLFLAPWLTMLCRSTLAGMVLTVAIPAVFLVSGDLIGGWIYGIAVPAAIDRVKFGVHFWGMLTVCAASAVAGWHAFMRLEVIEGRGREFHLPLRTGLRVRPGRRHPILSLVFKELRLQQLTFVLFGVFAAAGVALVAVPHASEDVWRLLLPVTMLYTALVSILSGSLTTAEERQFGTLDVQHLLPIAIWKQWVVKAGVALALPLALGLLLPQVTRMFLPEGLGDSLDDIWGGQLALMFILTSTSLYVSSISSSGVRAAVMSLPAIFGVMVFFGLVQRLLLSAYRSPFHLWVGSLIPVHLRDDVLRALMWTPLVFIASVSAIMLWLAFRNYRHGETSLRRIAFQIVCVAAVIILVITAEFLASAAAAVRFRAP